MRIWTKFRDIDNQQALICTTQEIHDRFSVQIWEKEFRNQPIEIETPALAPDHPKKYWRCNGPHFQISPNQPFNPDNGNRAICAHLIEIGD